MGRFERDFARRNDLRVFRYHTARGTISRDESDPLPLKLFPIYCRKDREVVRAVSDLMRQRNLELYDTYDSTHTDYLDIKRHVMSEVQSAHGYAIVFISEMPRVLYSSAKIQDWSLLRPFHADFRRQRRPARTFSDHWTESSTSTSNRSIARTG